MPEPVLAITHIHGIAGRRDELRALMRDTEQATAAEDGCRVYRFTVTLDDPDEYVHVQEWTSNNTSNASEETWKAHQRSPAFNDYQRSLFDLLARPSEMAIHRGAQTTRPAPSGPPDPRSLD